MWPQWINMLSPWQWTALGAATAAIFALYFLRLKRTPLEVPSTLLWRRMVEERRVNRLWQRLRRSLLLLLQLLLMALLLLALGRPSWEGSMLSGGRYVLLIDHSASMNATDVEPTRLAKAKQQAAELIRSMRPGDLAMLVSFSDIAEVVQSYTDDRDLLLSRLESIAPTSRRTSLAEALAVAAGLANPGTSAFETGDRAAAAPQPARLFILSDGKFADVEGFALDHLYPSENARPVFLSVSSAEARNVGITNMSPSIDATSETGRKVYVGLENFGDVDARVEVKLFADETLADVRETVVPSGGQGGVMFDLSDTGYPMLRARIASVRGASGETLADHLADDDEAWAAAPRPHRARVLVATAGNIPLENALGTSRARELADVTIVKPAALASPAIERAAVAGEYDLIVYDRCAPETNDDPAQPQKKMPQANTLFLGALPQRAADWRTVGDAQPAEVLDADASHPLLEWVEWEGVTFAAARRLELPQDRGARRLVEATCGVILAVMPRDGFEDVVLSAPLVGEKDGQQIAQTNWWQRPGFALFFHNALRYLGGRHASTPATVSPGASVELRVAGAADKLDVKLPDGSQVAVAKTRPGAFMFAQTEQPGAYSVQSDQKVIDSFAVSLLSRQESDIRPRRSASAVRGSEPGRQSIRIGYEELEAQTDWAPARREIWKLLLAAVLFVAGIEWYIYHRRVLS